MSEIRLLCKRCAGTGEVVSNQPDPLGGPYTPIMVTCNRCAGVGNFEGGMIVGGLLDKLDALDTKMDTLDSHLDTIENIVSNL